MMGGSLMALWLAACSQAAPTPTPTATPRASRMAVSPTPRPPQTTPTITPTPPQPSTPTTLPSVILEASAYPFQSPVALHYPEIPPEYQRAVDSLPLDGLMAYVLREVARDLRFVETSTQETTSEEWLMFRSDYVPDGLIEVGREAIGGPGARGDAGLNLPDDYLVYIDSRLMPTLRRIHQAAAANNVALLLTNAYRGYEHQAEIYGPADFIAYPGTSNHQSGFAIDLFLLPPGTDGPSNLPTRDIDLLLDDVVLGDSLIHPFGMADPPHFLALPPTLARLIHLAAEALSRDYNHLDEYDLALLQAAFYRRLNITVGSSPESTGQSEA
jgi:hypothetical protein